MAKKKPDEPAVVSVAPLGRFPVPDLIKAGIARFDKVRTAENEVAKSAEWAAGQAAFVVDAYRLYQGHLPEVLKLLPEAERKKVEKLELILRDVPGPPYADAEDRTWARERALAAVAAMAPADRQLRERVLEGIRVNAQTALRNTAGRGVNFIIPTDYRYRL